MRNPPSPRPLRLGVAALAVTLAAAGCASETGGQTSPGDSPSGSVGTLIDAKSAHGHHQLRQIPPDGAPQVRLRVRPDPHGGWNLHLVTKRFTFTPEHVNQQVQPNEGHAHLYIDGEKYTRIYSPWFFLPADAVSSGKHTLKVTLNANDHTTWAVDGNAISATATITSTGDSAGHSHGHHSHGHHSHGHHGAGHAHGQQQGGSQQSTAPVDVRLRVAVTDGQVSPPPHRVTIERGQTVRLVVTSDHPDRVHVHGYDLEQRVTPSQPAVITFTADRVGVFEVETHHSGLQLLQLQVQ